MGVARTGARFANWTVTLVPIRKLQYVLYGSDDYDLYSGLRPQLFLIGALKKIYIYAGQATPTVDDLEASRVTCHALV